MSPVVCCCDLSPLRLSVKTNNSVSCGLYLDLYVCILTIYKGAKWVREWYGVVPSTLRSWSNQGMLRCVRAPGGKRLYDSEQLRRLLGDREDPSTGLIIYVRVSSSKQRADLQCQVNRPGSCVMTSTQRISRFSYLDHEHETLPTTNHYTNDK